MIVTKKSTYYTESNASLIRSEANCIQHPGLK